MLLGFQARDVLEGIVHIVYVKVFIKGIVSNLSYFHLITISAGFGWLFTAKKGSFTVFLFVGRTLFDLFLVDVFFFGFSFFLCEIIDLQFKDIVLLLGLHYFVPQPLDDCLFLLEPRLVGAQQRFQSVLLTTS